MYRNSRSRHSPLRPQNQVGGDPQSTHEAGDRWCVRSSSCAKSREIHALHMPFYLPSPMQASQNQLDKPRVAHEHARGVVPSGEAGDGTTTTTCAAGLGKAPMQV
jgi:hypothetical protein